MSGNAANSFDLTGKIALVTGGSRGLGLAVARGLAHAGAQVTVGARTAPTSVDFPIDHLSADLSLATERATLVERVLQKKQRIDILFHAAGQQIRHRAEAFPLTDWDALISLHLTAAMHLSQLVAIPMLERQSGKIIHMSSILGFQGGLTVPAYAAAKHGLVGLVKALSNEWASRGVNVNALAPGYFATGVGEAVLADPVRGPQILSRIPAGRAGHADEIAGAAVFLASDASNYVHGHTLVVDGGWLGR